MMWHFLSNSVERVKYFRWFCWRIMLTFTHSDMEGIDLIFDRYCGSSIKFLKKIPKLIKIIISRNWTKISTHCEAFLSITQNKSQFVRYLYIAASIYVQYRITARFIFVEDLMMKQASMFFFLWGTLIKTTLFRSWFKDALSHIVFYSVRIPSAHVIISSAENSCSHHDIILLEKTTEYLLSIVRRFSLKEHSLGCFSLPESLV